MKASVIIPTKNGGNLFSEVLDAVIGQEAPWPFEVIVVDSGSSDRTVAICRDRGIEPIQIPSHEFGHGRTRNFAIKASRGDFIVMLTQDAKPASRNWLSELVAAVEQDDNIAGAFGRHLPYPGRDPFLQRDLKLHFDAFTAGLPVVRMDDASRYAADIGYRQYLHFFSDNNACLRRSVWERIPYPDVDFAEDQTWAKAIIEAGYAKAYADKAAVFHSHEYGVLEGARRAYDESRAFFRLFGYRLSPSLHHSLAQVVRCCLRDYRYLYSLPHPYRHAFWFFKLPGHHFAKHIGYFFGTRSGNESPLLDRFFSLDLSKKRT